MSPSKEGLYTKNVNRKLLLESLFTCPFCFQEKSCYAQMDTKTNTAFISCNVCSENFQTVINYLTTPSDVYNEWIKACNTNDI